MNSARKSLGMFMRLQSKEDTVMNDDIAKTFLPRLNQIEENPTEKNLPLCELLAQDIEFYAPIAIKVAIEGKGSINQALSEVIRVSLDLTFAIKLERLLPAQ